MASPIEQTPPGNLCATHKKPLDLVSITSRERICSNCALFGVHKGHDIKEETAVLEEIALRAEALTHLF